MTSAFGDFTPDHERWIDEVWDAPTRCGSCHAPAAPFVLPNGQTRFAYQHLAYCRIGVTLALAASPADVTDYLDGDLRGTAIPYEIADSA